MAAGCSTGASVSPCSRSNKPGFCVNSTIDVRKEAATPSLRFISFPATAANTSIISRIGNVTPSYLLYDECSVEQLRQSLPLQPGGAAQLPFLVYASDSLWVRAVSLTQPDASGRGLFERRRLLLHAHHLLPLRLRHRRAAAASARARRRPLAAGARGCTDESPAAARCFFSPSLPQCARSANRRSGRR